MIPNVAQDPEPLPYLRHGDKFTFDINLEVAIKPDGAIKPSTVCRYVYNRNNCKQ